MNKKIFVSFLLVLLVAISIGSVCAEDATDVLAVDDDVDVIAADVQPAGNTVVDVQNAIDGASEGDTVDISNYAEYDFADKGVVINKTITLDGKGTTTIKGYGQGQGLVSIDKAQNVVIQGIKFVDTNPANDFKYNGTTAGWGIGATAAHGGVVKDCEFTDFNSGIVVMQTTGFTIENSKFTGGYTTKLLNDPTVNKEQGSKSLNIYKQSSQVTVKNNTFDGPILDGVSIAQGSGSNYVIDNTFIGNCYSIYFGGASTEGSVIKGNKFINCGYFKEGDIFWEGLPVISMQKSSDGVAVDNNTFVAINNNVLLAAEKANEAHGSPTEIGNINITNNIVEIGSDVDASTVTLLHILVRDTGAGLNISSPIVVAENQLNGVKGVVVVVNDQEILSTGNIILNGTLDANEVFSAKTLFTTELLTLDLKVYAGNNGKLVALLTDNNGLALSNKPIKFVIDGVIKEIKTDNDGQAILPVKYASATTKYATVIFAGEGNLYNAAVGTAKITVVKKATKITASKATLKVKKAKKITVTLKTGTTPIKGQKITIKVNGKTFSAKTKANGKATISVKVLKKGKFTATISYAGNGAYKAATKKVYFTVKK